MAEKHSSLHDRLLTHWGEKPWADEVDAQTDASDLPIVPSAKTKTRPATGKIWGEDCRQTMECMADNSVSFILTDPPYFIDGMGDEWDHKALQRRVKPGVVASLPAGMKFDKTQGHRLQKFLGPIAQEWMRIIRPGGFVVCFSQNRLVHHAAMAIEAAGFEIRDILAWRYEGQAKAFTQDHFIAKRDISEAEKARLLVKLGGRKTPQLKPQCELMVLAQAPRDGTFVDNWDKWETGLIDVTNPVLDAGRFPGTVMSASKPRQRYGHMTAKPVDLLQHLIRIFSKQGAVVFDPFAGSGSTGVAAKLEGRPFIGSEIDQDMAEIAQQRVDDVAV